MDVGGVEASVAGEVEDEILNAPTDDGIIQGEDAKVEVEELPVLVEEFEGETDDVVDVMLIEEAVLRVLVEVAVVVTVVVGPSNNGVNGDKRPLKGEGKDGVFCFSGSNSPPPPPPPTDVRVS